MRWNYRVVKKIIIVEGFDMAVIEYGIHEAYYDEQNNVHSITENSVGVHGDSLEELKGDAESYMKALSLPVLDYDNIQNIKITLKDIEDAS